MPTDMKLGKNHRGDLEIKNSLIGPIGNPRWRQWLFTAVTSSCHCHYANTPVWTVKVPSIALDIPVLKKNDIILLQKHMWWGPLEVPLQKTSLRTCISLCRPRWLNWMRVRLVISSCVFDPRRVFFRWRRSWNISYGDLPSSADSRRVVFSLRKNVHKYLWTANQSLLWLKKPSDIYCLRL